MPLFFDEKELCEKLNTEMDCRHCYYFVEEIDIGTMIPWCTKKENFCNGNSQTCNYYLTKYDVKKMIDEYRRKVAEKS